MSETMDLILKLMVALKRHHKFTDAEIYDLLCCISNFLDASIRAKTIAVKPHRFTVVRGGKA